MSHTHPSRFTLVASMNPEEGELRPQLLDRFGLAVDIETSTDAALRTAAVSVQLAADRDPASLSGFVDADGALREQLESVTVGDVPADVVELSARVAVAVGAEGLRADLMLCRAAGALAGWEHRATATADDLRRVAPIVLAHRRRRAPFEDPGLSPHEIDDAFAPPPPETPSADGATEQQIPPEGRSEAPSLPSRSSLSVASGRRNRSTAMEGRHIRDVPANDDTTAIAVSPTAVAVATRRAVDPDATPNREDLRAAVRETKVGGLVILVVDTSGSMAAQRRIAAAKAVAVEFLTNAYQHRDRVAIITFHGERAEVVLRPTGSVEIARARLAELMIGGATPLADALETALTLARRAQRDQHLEPLLVLLTDGRATIGGDDPVATARAVASRVAAARVTTLVVDAETGPARLGLAAELAVVMHGECVALDDFSTQHITRHLRHNRWQSR
jgi:magnesium chelatase subunit D